MSSSLSSNQSNRLLEWSSHWGTITLYFCYISYKLEKPFSLDQLCLQIGLNEDYAYGYMVACTSFECFKFTTEAPEKGKIITVFDFDEIILRQIDSIINVKFKTTDNEFNIIVKKIEKFFGYNPAYP